MKQVIVISGKQGVGKTELALKLFGDSHIFEGYPDFSKLYGDIIPRCIICTMSFEDFNSTHKVLYSLTEYENIIVHGRKSYKINFRHTTLVIIVQCDAPIISHLFKNYHIS